MYLCLAISDGPKGRRIVTGLSGETYRTPGGDVGLGRGGWGVGGGFWSVMNSTGLVLGMDDNGNMQSTRLPGSGDRQTTLGVEWEGIDSTTGEDITLCVRNED